MSRATPGRKSRYALEWPEEAGRRRFLEIPALAGHLRLRGAAGRTLAELGPSWTLRRLELPPGEESFVAEVSPAPGDPLAGFLPWIGAAPHGLWQGLRRARTGPAAFRSPPRLRFDGAVLELHLDLALPPGRDEASLRLRGAGAPAGGRTVRARSGSLRLPWTPPGVWEPARPGRPDLRLHLDLLHGGRVSDTWRLALPARRLEARGERLLLNGRPFRVRGLLHWGWEPGAPGPAPEPEVLRRHLHEMKRRGFNLLKACLFVPPPEYLEVCTEEGMAVWQEYPLWAAPLRDPRVGERLLDLVRADAHHPCIVLRTLSCENDEMEPSLVRRLVEEVKRLCPGTLAAGQSAWIGRAHAGDFDDEHPYLHPGPWPFYLERLQRMREARTPRPLLLGETFVADATADPRSRRLALDLRRREAEAFLRAFPEAGYVVCGERDIPGCPLGLRDRHGRWKDPAPAWAWQAGRSSAPRPPRAAAPAGMRGVSALDGEARQALEAGATLLHHASARSLAFRIREHLHWSPVPVLAPFLRGDRAFGRVLEADYHDLLSGFALAREAGLPVLVVEDHHDQGGFPRRVPLILAGRVGAGRLLVSSLRPDEETGSDLHARILAALPEAQELPPLALETGPASFFLDGPWELRGPGVRGGRALVRPGSLAANAGANAFFGRAEARARIRLPGAWSGPVLLRAEALGDGWRLFLDGVEVHVHGRPGCTWDAGRDNPATVDLGARFAPGETREFCFEVHDHRGAGALVGPLYLCNGDPEAGELYGPPPALAAPPASS